MKLEVSGRNERNKEFSVGNTMVKQGVDGKILSILP
jgi:hypothetical protein